MAVEWGIPVIKGVVHEQYLRMAYQYAMSNSMDPRTKTAAVITNSSLDKVLGRGTNVVRPGLKLGVDYQLEHLRDSNWKKENMIHSEDNTIANAISAGNSLFGSVMYMFWVPCTPCANLVVDSGIKKYIAHRQMMDRTPERWVESCLKGVELMKNAGVSVLMYDGKLGGVAGRMNDEDWQP